VRLSNSPTAAADELLEELRPLLAEERARFAARCHARGISIAHLHLMGLLERDGAMTMTAVAASLGTELPTATGLVDRMEDRGLVVRDRDERDRRVVLVRLSQQGAAVLSEIHALRRERLAAAMGHLDGEQQRRLLQSVQDLRRAFARVENAGSSSQ
jgi:DNA-binding MarR family transcriptional regulator